MAVFKGLAQLIRLPNFFTVASNIIAAHFIASAGAPQWHLLFLTLLASACFYHGGMILNDCFDYEEDRQSRPNRPLPAGLMSVRQAWRLGFALLMSGLALAYLVSFSTLLIACGLAAAVIVYNASSREGFMGCVAMGICRSLNWCLGLSAVAGWLVFWPYAMVVGIYVAALTVISRDETSAERPSLVFYCAGVMVLGAVAFLSVLWFQGHGFQGRGFQELGLQGQWIQDTLILVASIIFVVGLGLILQRLINLKRHYNPESIQNMVMVFVLGLIPLDAVLVFMAGYPLAAIVILLFIFPSRFLARRLYVT